ncbi:MAG: resistance to Congo red protein [Thermodesulfobacteriota bacterium]
MDTISLIPRVSLWAVFFGTFFLVILSIFLCYRISVYNAKRSPRGKRGQ